MAAFSDKSIKGIVSCIGGDDSIRMLPYIDFDVIHNNPKVFIGYSDTTVGHFICMKAGLSSFYGPAILTDFAENIAMPDYTVDAVKKAIFNSDTIGEIKPSDIYTAQRLEWLVENKNTARKFYPNNSYDLLQGSGTIKGRLIGGCLEVINNIKGTDLFPSSDYFDDAILFLETCEVIPPVWFVEDNLRSFGAMGILNRLSGIFWGKPQGGALYDVYKSIII